MALQHLVELDDRLRGVQGERPPGRVGAPLGLDQQLGCARVDLGGREVAADEPAVGAVVLVEELHRPGEPLASRLLVPFPRHAAAVAREPAARAKRQPHVDAQPVVRGALDDVGAHGADLHAGRHPAAQQLGHREVHAGAAGRLVLRLAAHGQHLEEARVPELRAAAVLDERAVERRAGDVGVGGDEARRQHAVARVDRLVRGALERAADVDDALALDENDAVAQQAVAAAVEGDDPAGADRGAPRHYLTSRRWPGRAA